MTFGWAQASPGADRIPQRVCSNSCFDAWTMGLVTRGFAPVAWGPTWSIQGVVVEPTFASRAQQIAQEHQTNLQLAHARNLLDAERFEDAARIYEGLGMWKEAGEARRHAKRTVVTQVQVDVNGLIDQVRRGGLTTTYACPACHSPIQITGNTDVHSLTHCQYCGSVIQSTDLVDFLTRVVGYR